MTNFANLLSQASAVAADASAALRVLQWFKVNQAVLMLHLRAGAINNARELLREFLDDNPLAAGYINYLMTANVDQAIGAVALYDPTLAQQLSECKANFAQLQSEWSAAQ